VQGRQAGWQGGSDPFVQKEAVVSIEEIYFSLFACCYFAVSLLLLQKSAGRTTFDSGDLIAAFGFFHMQRSVGGGTS
jgi:hypothetical protein